jgi:ParB family chromosome partitioning protein
MEDQYKVYLIPAGQIVPGNNDRQNFDEVELAELAGSIAEDGLTNPITVKPIGFICLETGRPAAAAEELAGQGTVVPLYRIAAGERRFRAMTANLGWQEIPAFIREMDVEQESSVMLSENLGRVDLDPVEEAQAYQKRIEEHGWSEEKIAAKGGVTVARVVARLKLLRLVPEAAALVSRGTIPLGHAEAMVELKPSLQVEAVKLLGRANLTHTQFKQYLAQLVEQDSQPQPLFDLAAFWEEQAKADAQRQAELRARQFDIPTRDDIPPVRADRRDTAGDIIVRYLVDLRDGGQTAEAAVIGNLLTVLLRFRKVKNFREHPALNELLENAGPV